MRKLFCLLILMQLLAPLNFFTQTKKVDSLKIALLHVKSDTARIGILNKIAYGLCFINPDSAVVFAQRAADLSKKISYKRGEAASYGNLGIAYIVIGDYPKALQNNFSALKIDEALNNKYGMSTRLGNIGIVYSSQADYPQALNNFFKALQIGENLNDKNLIATNLGNIGLVYKEQANYPKALEYFFKRMKLDKESGSKSKMAININNIAIVYMEQAHIARADKDTSKSGPLYRKALSYYFDALKLCEDLEDKNRSAGILGNIGIVYRSRAEALTISPDKRIQLFVQAGEFYNKALKTYREVGSKSGVALELGNLGVLNVEMMKFARGAEKNINANQAELYLEKSLAYYDTLGEVGGTMEFERYFSALDSLRGNYLESLIHYKKFIAARDTIRNEENTKKQTRHEMQYEFDKKETASKIEQEKKDLMAKAELNRKEQQRNYFIAGFILVVLLALLILRGYAQKQKVNKIITAQKEEVEKQKQLVEEHQKEILDSIRYARRIQHALLPTEKYITRVLNSNKTNARKN